eukprot:symbB.v1.2.020529.t1/scaffold1734.1/size154044/14
MRRFEPEVLLADALQFEVSHQMLSALEAAYSWEKEDAEPKLVLWREGKLCWEVKRIQTDQKQIEEASRLPTQAAQVSRGWMADNLWVGVSLPCQANLLPFLLHNLDTGETTILEEEWNTYLVERNAGPAAAELGHGPDAKCKLEATSAQAMHHSKAAGLSGTHWLEGRQREALRALGKV